MSTDRAASPPAWARGNRGQACRSGECAIAAEAIMNNVGQVRSKEQNPQNFPPYETFVHLYWEEVTWR
jgi:hypothetical protein